jgi:CDP-paratose 2-epimerase
MKILVTGAAGFVGSHVAEFYARKGNQIVAFDNLSRTKILGKQTGIPTYNWKYLKDNYENVKFVRGDVTDFRDVKSASDGIDTIAHTAAQVAVTTSISDPRTDFKINAMGTFNVLEAARLSNAALIFCSTNKVYGNNVNKIPVREGEKRYSFDDEEYSNGTPESLSIDLCEHTPYGSSKLAADLYVQDYAHTYGLKTGVFRMSCIYGERQFGVEDQGWVSWFAIASFTKKPITIYGDGKQVRDVLHVSDLMQAFDKFLSSNMRHDVFNIGGGPENTISLLELLELLKELTGKTPVVSFAGWRSADQRVYISDISKAQRLLGWKPAIGPKEGVARLVKWISENDTVFG